MKESGDYGERDKFIYIIEEELKCGEYLFVRGW